MKNMYEKNSLNSNNADQRITSQQLSPKFEEKINLRCVTSMESLTRLSLKNNPSKATQQKSERLKNLNNKSQQNVLNSCNYIKLDPKQQEKFLNKIQKLQQINQKSPKRIKAEINTKRPLLIRSRRNTYKHSDNTNTQELPAVIQQLEKDQHHTVLEENRQLQKQNLFYKITIMPIQKLISAPNSFKTSSIKQRQKQEEIETSFQEWHRDSIKLDKIQKVQQNQKIKFNRKNDDALTKSSTITKFDEQQNKILQRQCQILKEKVEKLTKKQKETQSKIIRLERQLQKKTLLVAELQNNFALQKWKNQQLNNQIKTIENKGIIKDFQPIQKICSSKNPLGTDQIKKIIPFQRFKLNSGEDNDLMFLMQMVDKCEQSEDCLKFIWEQLCSKIKQIRRLENKADNFKEQNLIQPTQVLKKSTDQKNLKEISHKMKKDGNKIEINKTLNIDYYSNSGRKKQ